MTRPDIPDIENGITALLNLFVGGVTGYLVAIAVRAFSGGNTFLAGAAAIGALVFIAIVAITQASDWLFWRYLMPKAADPVKRPAKSRFRRYSLLIGFAAGFAVAFIWIPQLMKDLL